MIDYSAPGESTRLVFLPEEDAIQADMDAFGNGGVNLVNIDTATPGVICFASGTRLMTASASARQPGWPRP